MWKRITVLFVLVVLTLSACASRAMQEQAYAPESIVQSKSAGGAAAPYGEAAPMEAPLAPGSDSNTESAAPAERLVIKNADLEVVVEDPPTVMDDISTMAEAMGGYVVSANLYQTTLEGGGSVPRGNITIRVPAAHLNEALQQIKAHSSQLPLREEITSQDVTSEYTDLNSRLRNLEVAEAQLQKIMENAYTTDDVLNVYNQLVNVRQEIEVTKGRIQYLEQSAALSAISVDLIADAAVQPISIGGWQPSGVAKDAIRALIRTYQGLANFLIWLVLYILPVAAVILLPLYFLGRAFLRWRRKRKAQA